MIGCEACERAEHNPHTGLCFADCHGCQARMLAQSPQFWEAMRARDITGPYGDALRKVFGDNWEQGHQAVKHWHRSLTRARAHLKASL